jgi:pyruvoyl-dependent arginine decarboxylase (PvlArgDC)
MRMGVAAGVGVAMAEEMEMGAMVMEGTAVTEMEGTEMEGTEAMAAGLMNSTFWIISVRRMRCRM